MKKDNKKVIILSLILIILIGLYLSFNYINIEDIKQFFSNTYLNILSILFILLILYIVIFYNKGKTNELRYRDKLFATLVENTDTIYIMINSLDNKILYLSDNIEEVLGLKLLNDKINKKEIVKDILNIPILKSELRNWNRKDEYVSPMLSYDNPKYNHQTWIKIKIYPYNDKKNGYNVIQISDVSKDHDRQHLLITQTSDIKSREKQLNQITASSYDVEINLNINTHTYELKYFKLDMKYFGQEKSGNYNTDFNDIVRTYINTSDQEEVLKILSIDNFTKCVLEKKFDPISIRYRLGNKVKDNIWLESTAFFITNKDKVNISILTKNVTENAESIREQNILLQNTLNEAKEANNAKTELIKTISHDIRTPMTNIKGLSEELLNKKLDNNIKDDIENINESCNEVIEIINGLLDVSKIEKTLITKEEKKYNILQLFNKITEQTKDYIGTKNIKLSLDMDSNLPVILYGDSKRLNQILKSIINNSIKFTNEGKINISVRGEKIDNNVKLYITVKDTGCGIAEDKLATIFDKKADNNTGLLNVKNLIDLLGGTIEIESKLNEYTSVTITLIQKIIEDNKVREILQHNQTTQSFSLKGKKVLIVDDNALNLKVTSRILQSYDIETTLVESGEECLDYVKNSEFDLILLDQMMPGLNGVETLKKLKEIDGFNTPVIVLTADAMSGQKEKYIDAGFNDYLSKPIDKKELNRILKEYLKNN